jgi:hypothetical protein
VPKARPRGDIFRRLADEKHIAMSPEQSLSLFGLRREAWHPGTDILLRRAAPRTVVLLEQTRSGWFDETWLAELAFLEVYYNSLPPTDAIIEYQRRILDLIPAARANILREPRHGVQCLELREIHGLHFEVVCRLARGTIDGLRNTERLRRMVDKATVQRKENTARTRAQVLEVVKRLEPLGLKYSVLCARVAKNLGPRLTWRGYEFMSAKQVSRYYPNPRPRKKK